MNLTINDKNFENIQDLLAGFITADQADQLKFHLIASPNLSFNTAMQLIQSITVNLLTTFVSQKPEALEDVYDAYNFMASSILDTLMPNPNKDLDEEAIKRVQASIIEEEFAKLTPEQKEQAKLEIEKLKEKLIQNENQ